MCQWLMSWLRPRACVFALNMSSVWHILRRAYIMLGVLGCWSLSHPTGKFRRCSGRGWGWGELQPEVEAPTLDS